MTRSKARVGLTTSHAKAKAALQGGTADILARGWIAAFRPLEPTRGELAGDLHTAVEVIDDWTVETVLKLGVAAPDKAYDVAVRIVELSDDPWILANVGVGVFED